jgi:hypothetical protein
MKQLMDVVNFNADGSCLPAETWLAALRGGRASRLCQWLGVYVARQKRVSLGLVGATAADMVAFNPDAVRLINQHPEIFEILLRPFAHDIALLRTTEGFQMNIGMGLALLESEFAAVTPCFLPPEFMLTNAQVTHLARRAVTGVFINASRFKAEVAARVPTQPYLLAGVLGVTLKCLPLSGALTRAYLDAIHLWSDAWPRALAEMPGRMLGSWRDGEGCFFVPAGVEREASWLASEPADVERVFVRDVLAREPFVPPTPGLLTSYPLHSCSEWLTGFRMLGYLGRVGEVEARLSVLSREEQAVWLQTINSDVLSAVEKEPPRVALRARPGQAPLDQTFERSQRGFEGEDYLAILDGYPATLEYVERSERPHMQKLRARRDAVRRLP